MRLRALYKSLIEHHNGRIDWSPGNWVWNPTNRQMREIEESGGWLHKSKDAQGKAIVLVKQRGVNCHNHELCAGKYPQTSDKGRSNYFVPLAHCRKCQHYRKRKKGGLPYPHCAHRRQALAGQKGADAALLELATEAIKTAIDITGRGPAPARGASVAGRRRRSCNGHISNAS